MHMFIQAVQTGFSELKKEDLKLGWDMVLEELKMGLCVYVCVHMIKIYCIHI